jgi:two-component system chemotaxis response regulator CheY
MKKVLVVDDSPTMRRMVMAALRGIREITFNEAASGLQAIESLAVAPVDLILLDLNMPDIHGLEVLRFIRTHGAFQDTPVVILTTRDDAESRAAADEAGATLYMTKPFVPSVLVPEVRRLLEDRPEQ